MLSAKGQMAAGAAEARGAAAPCVETLFMPRRVERAPARRPRRAPHVATASTADAAVSLSAAAAIAARPLAFLGRPVVTDPLGSLVLPPTKQQRQEVYAPPPKPRRAPGRKPPLRLGFAGSGVYFFWQLGAIQWLMERYNLAEVPMVGASGGGLAAVLGACGVNPDVVLQTAYELSLQYRVSERKLGLVGVWGGIIEEWLDSLLPDNAAEICSRTVKIVVTELPRWKQVAYSDFVDKRDLINVAMASAHVPLVLDWRVARSCRGKACVDGSFPDFFTNVNSELLTMEADGGAVVFDYFDDPNIVRSGRMDMLSMKDYNECRHIMRLGHRYAQRLADEGMFDRFDAADVLLAA